MQESRLTRIEEAAYTEAWYAYNNRKVREYIKYLNHIDYLEKRVKECEK